MSFMVLNDDNEDDCDCSCRRHAMELDYRVSDLEKLCKELKAMILKLTHKE